jgi:hypothetical protein
MPKKAVPTGFKVSKLANRVRRGCAKMVRANNQDAQKRAQQYGDDNEHAQKHLSLLAWRLVSEGLRAELISARGAVCDDQHVVSSQRISSAVQPLP